MEKHKHTEEQLDIDPELQALVNAPPKVNLQFAREREEQGKPMPIVFAGDIEFTRLTFGFLYGAKHINIFALQGVERAFFEMLARKQKAIEEVSKMLSEGTLPFPETEMQQASP